MEAQLSQLVSYNPTLLVPFLQAQVCHVANPPAVPLALPPREDQQSHPHLALLYPNLHAAPCPTITNPFISQEAQSFLLLPATLQPRPKGKKKRVRFVDELKGSAPPVLLYRTPSEGRE